MRILADENIPVVDAFFADQGSIRRLPGRAIDRAALAEVDVLLVRSVTEVSRAALAGSPVRFVGTCTIGTDHLDLDYFAEAGIAWSSAPGCNARGVVDYVLGCLLAMAEVRGADLAERTYGVVGAGQVGGRLVEVLRGLGWKVLVCDPPRQAREPDGEFVSLERLLAEADVISLHTPLNRDGEHPTRHLLDEPRLAALRPGTWLVNASRGAVVDNQALRRRLEGGADLEVALDVWEGEPQADPELAARCLIATPHIAGYSLEGKLRGTAQIYQAYCVWRGIAERVSLQDVLPETWLAGLQLNPGCDPAWALATLCRAVYDPRSDHAAFRRSLTGDSATRRAAFDALRKHYPPRREITGLRVATGGQAGLQRVVRALGAQLV
ncbi:4-phosphoerythronate dehydrogenase PdxB [Pseudomonas aeruginosa]|uniref:4-phosphoerythronate dehydrogenase PdxB n=1 Tax=Pseudomonas aeruginosa TaxID=287 RepID=UPI000B48D7CA|nr:4-phosphoerythronate dehydrogenase PdxB [Pseudomonas aeruginosa]OWI99491.1 4-phosphoerythronate dehydrogenase [Pseudomonas aeruginosa]